MNTRAFLRNKSFTSLPSAVKNTVISSNFLVWKFCGKAYFPQSLGGIAQNCAEIVPFHKIYTPGNKVKLRYFSWCCIWEK